MTLTAAGGTGDANAAVRLRALAVVSMLVMLSALRTLSRLGFGNRK